jgi:hypothetical protein
MAKYSKNWNVDEICKQNMNYPSQNHLVSGFCRTSSILKTRKHNILETESDSVLR